MTNHDAPRLIRPVPLRKAPFEGQARLIAHNTLLNLLSLVAVGIVAIFAVPVTVRGLGVEVYGILSLTLVVLGYLSVLNFGLGRATTKFVAEYVGRGKMEELPILIGTSLATQVLLGIISGVAFAACVPLLVTKVFVIQPALVGQAQTSFLLTAISVPILMASSTLRGVLEGAQRFDMVNAVKIPLGVVNYLIPVVGVFLKISLPSIVMFLALAKLVSIPIFFVMSCRVFPGLWNGIGLAPRLLRQLVPYGSWVMVSFVIEPILMNLDRPLIATYWSVSKVTYFSAPYELATSLWILPASMASAMFPAVTRMASAEKGEALEGLLVRCIKFLLLMLAPLTLTVVFFARTIVTLWLGPNFAAESTPVLQALSIGVLFHALGMSIFFFLQGFGRPDITGKIHLFELPLFGLFAWYMVREFGVPGAAWGWALRLGLDAIILFGAAWRLRLVSVDSMIRRGLFRVLLLLSGLAMVMLISAAVSASRLGINAVLAGLGILLFSLGVWKQGLDSSDKCYLRSFVTRGAAPLSKRGVALDT
jgi:O-antigen/teichoic acid export membrane protein